VGGGVGVVALELAALAWLSLVAVLGVWTTHFASLSMTEAFTGPATTCSTRPSGAQKYDATLPPCLAPLTILNVATFWNDETKYSLRYLPTASFANAPTRSASALFQVKRGSSK